MSGLKQELGLSQGIGLLAMVGWKSLYAVVMLAALWLFLPKRNAV